MNSFIGRQPIFDKKMSVFGYELLYRGSEIDNFFDDNTDPDIATSHTVMNSFLGVGIDKLTGGKYAFINFTEKLINDGIATLFPNDFLVVELLENILPTPAIIESCVRLREAGYKIALDDFIISPEYFPLIKISNFIKIDFLSTPIEQIKFFVKMVKKEKIKIKLLAEKIETKTQFKEAHDLGFSYFQGYFFAKPTIVVHKDVAPSKLVCLDLLRFIMEEDFDFRQVANIIRKEVTLYYKLLRLINSSYFSPLSYIHSAQHALAILGMQEARKWLTLVIMMRLKTDDKPGELISLSLVRARFFELLSVELKRAHESQAFYLLGLFSFMDVITDVEMSELVKRINIDKDIAHALVNKSGFYGMLLELAAGFELGKWKDVESIAKKLHLNAENLSKIYVNSLTWAGGVLTRERSSAPKIRKNRRLQA